MTKTVALVVGVGPGLGSALARRFAKAGMAVAMARRNPNQLDELAKEIDGHSYACDVTDPASVETLFEAVDRDLGVPSLVVFNAGTLQRGGILEITPEEFEREWRVGCMGGFLVGQAAARRMGAAGKGTILYTGATAALRGSAGFMTLAVPKFGLRALAQSMARELGPKGIHVAHVIIDGLIAGDRPGFKLEEHGQDAVLDPGAIAEAYYQIHLQPKSAWTQEMDLRPWVENF